MSRVQGAIAVVGLSCRYPGASSVQEFWETILAQRTQFRAYPKQRLPMEHYLSEDPHAVDKSYLGRAAFLDGWLFDRISWRIPQSTWDATDPAHWLALELADSAIRQAGGKERLSKGRTAVYVGNTLTGEFTRSRSLRLRWPYVGRTLARVLEQHQVPQAQQEALLKQFQEAYQAPFAPTSEDTLAGGLSNTISGRICGHFDFRGGGYTVDGACSSSLLAVVTAVERLAIGEIDFALAGGVDLSLDPFELVGFAKAVALCRNDLRIYDERASGMIPGEGAGFVVLKRLEDAKRDRDAIYAVIRGWGVSSDGKGAITAPKAEGQAQAVADAWQRAAYRASDLDFVEGHGTGTALGDPTEILGLAKAQERQAGETKPSCGLTSLKSIVGHTKAAAGIGALIKSILCVNQRVLPPSAGCERPHPAFAETEGSLFPVRYGKIYAPSQTLRGGVSAMGFGGINAHVTIESADPPSPLLRSSVAEEILLRSARNAEVLVGSSHSKQGLIEAVQALQARSAGIADGELVDLSAETWSQPVQTHRFAVVARHARDLANKLEQLEAHLTLGEALPEDVYVGSNAERPRIGVVFPGQGSHAPNMGRRTLSAPYARQSLETMFQALDEAHAKELRHVLHPEEQQPSEAALSNTLSRTELAQPAITWASYAWWCWLQELSIQPEKVAGHSLGELMALHAAGAIEESLLFQLAASRGASMIGTGDDGMLVLKCDAKDAALVLQKANTQSSAPERDNYALIANQNGHQQTVVAGALSALDMIVPAAEEMGVVCRRLSVSRAFHSGLMQGAAKRMSQVECPSQATLKRTWVSSVEPERVWESVELSSYLAKQITAPVDFTGVMEQFSDMDLVLEVGPGRTLSGLFQRHGGPLCLPLEGRFGADEYTGRAVATLFVMNAPICGEALFAHRFVRPFVPASERAFLINPCERYAEGTPVSLPELTAQAEVDAQGGGSLPAAQSVLEQLFAVIEQQTGFPTTTLRPEHRLLDDLHLDSIKSGELIARVAQLLDCAGHIDPLELANARLDEIAQTLEEAQHATSTQTEHFGSWVATFASTRVPAGRPEHSLLDAWKGQEIQWLGQPARASAPILSVLEDMGCEQVDASHHKILCLPAENFEVGCLVGELVELAHSLVPGDQVVIIDPSCSPGGTRTPSRMDGVRAFASSLHLENPRVRVYVVSIPALGAVEEALRDTFLSLDATQSFGYVEVCGDEAPQHLQMRYLAEPEAAELLPMPEGVVLATGGARGITARCLIEIAQEYGGHFALVGRSPLGDEAKQTLSALREAGADAAYYQADLCLQEDVDRLVGEVEAKQGRISWLFHGAGMNKPRRASTVSEEEARREVAPKLQGMQHLLTAIPGDQIQRITALTSIIGEVGMPGNAWYAYSNESLHRLLTLWHRNNGHALVRCLASSVWGEIGMGARMGSVEQLKSRGIEAISPDEGARLSLLWACASEAPSQVFLTARLGQEALDTWKQPIPSFAGPMVQTILEETPEVEACFGYQLDPEKDAYLNDHVFEGTILFPTVFAVEWMAQGVRRVLGESFGTFVLEDLRLSRPVVVDPDKGTQVRLHVLRLGKDRFQCSIFCESTGFSIAHFESFARVHQTHMRDVLPCESPVLEQAAEPQRDLYGSLLFQGERFQRLQKITSLESGHCLLQADHGLQSEGPWFMREEELLLGSPYLRDAMLQSGQLLIAPRQGLPVAVDRWVFSAETVGDVAPIDVVLLDDIDDTVTGCVRRLDGDRHVVEQIEGYQIKVLQTLQGLPGVDELRERSLYLSQLVTTRLEGVAQSLSLSLPTVKVLCRAGIGDAEQGVRRAAAEELFGEGLVWDEEGKPSSQGGAHVSVTHDGELLMVAHSGHPVGIDVLALEGRAWEEMTALVLKDVAPKAPQLADPGAHIWAAREALAKVRGVIPESFEVLSAREREALFSDGSHRVLTMQVALGQREWLLALTCLPDGQEAQQANHALSLYTLEDHMRGARGETLFKYRFPMTFDAVGNPSGGVHFAQLIHWLGHTREIGIRPSGLYQAAIQHVASGEYAWVTKETALRVVGSAAAGDLIEVECWNERLYGPDDASLEMIYQWYSVSPFGERRRLAESAQTTTWARVLGHGVVQPAPYPNDMLPWLAATLPSREQGSQTLSWSESQDTGDVIWKAPPGPQPGLLLAQEAFRTTPRNANMVGNVYWANYFDWMGEVRDIWAQNHAPFGTGELRCTGTSIQHLREAMPGDRVVAKMYLEEQSEWGFAFSFSFFRLEADGQMLKLAQGNQTASWFVPQSGDWIPGTFPFSPSSQERQG